MLPKSELASQLQSARLDFVSASVSCADFVFEGEAMRLRIEAHAPGVFRVRCGEPQHLDPDKISLRAQQHADTLLARHEAVGELACSTLANGEGWQLIQGDVRLEISAMPLCLRVYRGERCVMRSVSEGVRCDEAQALRAWHLDLELADDEGVYGLGESSNSLDRRGEQRVSDVPKDRVLPLLWSTEGWGVYFNTLGRTAHDVACSEAGQYRGTMHAVLFDVFIFVGEPVEILNQYTALTGRAGQPGLWPMGVWLDQAPGQSLTTTLQQIRNMREQALGMDAFTLAAPAAVGFQNDKPAFEWSERLPEWRGFMSECEALNVRCAVQCFPGVVQGTGLFEEWEDRGWLLCNDQSEAYVFPGQAVTDGRGFALLDLTHKDVYRLWVERQTQVIEDGLGTMVCQAQFDIPDEVVARAGESGAVLRTLYPALVRRALFDAVAGDKTPQEGVLLSRDVFPGVQRYAWQQGPEPSNDWAGMAMSLKAALAMGNSGVTAQTHLLGSAQHPASGMSAELYVRWLAMCVFSANFSFQGRADLMPDAFGPATRELVAHWLRWRYRLLPYVSGIIEDAVRTGLPVQRSMALAFPDDPEAHVWESQYLFGPALLVAPVMQPGGHSEVYLPAGDAWWDLSTGWRYEGGTRWSVPTGLDSLPVFGREGHMLCLGPVGQHTGEFNSARILDEVWMFGMPEHSPVVMRNKIRVMQMQGSSYIKGLEGLRILPSEGLEVKRRGAEVRISRAR